MQEIEDLAVLLAPKLGDKKIVSYKTKNLIAAGENYGSIMLAVDLKVKEATKEEEDLHLVAKLCPPTEFIKKMFNIPVVFKKEVGFYSKVIPTLQEFQKARGCKEVIDFFPDYYGSRITLNGRENVVDDNACLVLENIKVKGYDIGDRLKGFNLETAKYIIKDLARFHAVPIALKLKNPEVFKENISPYLISHMNADMLPIDMRDSIKDVIIATAKQNAECVKYLDRIINALNKGEDNLVNQSLKIREPFATIVHNDFWVNNTMLKFDANGHPIANAMVDFQLVVYGNPMHDLLFFIYTSTTNEVREKYQELIDFYYETFIKVLKELKVDLSMFDYEAFLAEIEFAAKHLEFYHICLMLKPIFTDKNKVKDLKDMNANELSDTSTLSDEYFPKMWGTILDFVKRDWI